ncbi:MAG: hypothetical protein DMF68_21825, partial [Acidobacteria bacterium]
VGFVVTFVVKEKAFNNCHIENRVYINSEQKLNQAVLGALISRLQSLLPQPVQSPANALHRIKGKNPNAGLYRSILTMNRGVTMSARMLLEILSGERTIEDFEREYKMRREENPFRQRLLEGRLINNINIEQSLVDDDDRATIQFGEIDPAVHLFRLKK